MLQLFYWDTVSDDSWLFYHNLGLAFWWYPKHGWPRTADHNLWEKTELKGKETRLDLIDIGIVPSFLSGVSNSSWVDTWHLYDIFGAECKVNLAAEGSIERISRPSAESTIYKQQRDVRPEHLMVWTTQKRWHLTIFVGGFNEPKKSPILSSKHAMIDQRMNFLQCWGILEQSGTVELLKFQSNKIQSNHPKSQVIPKRSTPNNPRPPSDPPNLLPDVAGNSQRSVALPRRLPAALRTCSWSPWCSTRGASTRGCPTTSWSRNRWPRWPGIYRYLWYRYIMNYHDIMNISIW
jgi:hypothetical protein